MILKKRLGQHLLIDRGILKKEAALLDCGGKTALEIGSGDGRLTRELLAAGAKHVTAVEKDRAMVAELNRKFHSNKRVEIVHMDILEFPPGKFGGIIGNIPYYISSPILFRLPEFEFDYAILCVQKEFGEKMAAKPGAGNYGRLSVMAQYWFGVEELLHVPKIAFAPVPRVDSVLVGLRKRHASRDEKFERVANALFQHRLKTVRASLGASWKALGVSKWEARALGDRVKYRERRVFTLSPQEIIEIAEMVG